MRFALRQLAKSPGFTVVALLTLALGIGINTTAFTVLNRFLLQSLPFHDSSRLVQVWSVMPRGNTAGHAPGDFFDEQEQNTVFSSMAAYIPGGFVSFAEQGQAAVTEGSVAATANFFAVIGVSPVLGRLPSSEEEARFEPVTMLSNQFWRSHYNADPTVLGRTIRLAGTNYTVIGVMPPSLDDPTLFNVPPCFFPLDPMKQNRDFRGAGWYTVVARLKPGVTIEEAQAEMTVLGARFSKDHPKTNLGRTFRVIPFPTTGMNQTRTQLTWMTLALTALVLLIACVNLANLQLVRTTRRAQEIGIRLALGSSGAQVIGMVVLESVILSVAGGTLGILVAFWSSAYVAQYFSINMPLDLRVIAFTFGVSLITGIIFGTVPAWLASHTDINATLKSGGRGATSSRSRHWLRQGLVVMEIGLALILLAGAGFFVRGIYLLSHRQLKWDTAHEIIAFIQLDNGHFGEAQDPRLIAFGDRVKTALLAIPGVEAVDVARGSPAWGDPTAAYRQEGQPAPETGHEHYAGHFVFGPDFFKVYGVSLIQGRMFKDSDTSSAPPVVIVNETMAKKLWPGQDPIGKRIGGVDPAAPHWAEVVGVMSDFETGGEFYYRYGNQMKFAEPWAQNSHRFIYFAVRTFGDPAVVRESVRKTMGLMAPDIALTNLDTASEIMGYELHYFSFLRQVLMQIAGLGLLLAAIGIYGVVANLASERTKEIGIRMALGAQPSSIIWLFLKGVVHLAVAGSVVGATAGYALVVILSRILSEVPGRDPRVIAGVTIMIFAVALIACWLPARRATKVNPTVALRAE
jgi:putative ABC transport system permease protein